MPKLIKDANIIDNQWSMVETTDTPVDASIPAGNVIVPLNVWKAKKAELSGRAGEIGVWLSSDEFAEELRDDARDLPLIALHFATFMDGRAFTTARLLRERFGFSGELRASGAIIRDQLCYLRRCGVNAFHFSDSSIKLESALESLSDFSDGYQTSVDQKTPLSQRR
jgi:uncharacterized protein (DUF934 family)